MTNEEGDISAPFWEHVSELRAVLLKALFAILLGLLTALYFSDEALAFIKSTLNLPLSLFSPQEGFLALFKIAFWIGFLGTSPYWILGILRFIQPALRGKIKRLLPGFTFLSLLFITSGITLCLFVTLPLANQFFYDFNRSIGNNLWGFEAYVDFLLLLIFAHGTAFEIGALLLLLIHMGVLHWKTLAEKRRHAALFSLIMGALLTPPDILTQLLIAIPLMGFYELAILYGKMRQKKEND
jgi:sec-independent protein translocase protein TatC